MPVDGLVVLTRIATLTMQDVRPARFLLLEFSHGTLLRALCACRAADTNEVPE